MSLSLGHKGMCCLKTQRFLFKSKSLRPFNCAIKLYRNQGLFSNICNGSMRKMHSSDRSKVAYSGNISYSYLLRQKFRKVSIFGNFGKLRSLSSSTNLRTGMSPVLSPIFLNTLKYHNDIAIIDKIGAITYADILHHGILLCTEIIEHFNCDGRKIDDQRIALLTENDACYVIGQYATWFAGGVSVPLCQDHPVSMWEYFLENSECSLVLVSQKFLEKISPLTDRLRIPVIELTRDKYNDEYAKNANQQSLSNSETKSFLSLKEESTFPNSDVSNEYTHGGNPALIVYTSGTTGRPKGVVLTHDNLLAMVSGMMKSWAWSKNDVILHVLPLHHVHGIINCLLTPLACGATCVMEPAFDAKRIWNLLTNPMIQNFDRDINLFMAVPTIYTKLIEYFDKQIATESSNMNASFILAETSNKIRLMVSGSAALPTPVSDRWFDITGHRLLERYGMTEIGMALTNPLKGKRIPGAVGKPFPNVEVRIVRKSSDDSTFWSDVLAEGNDSRTTVTEGAEDEPGELLIKGPSVFKEYWNNPKATTESFTEDGWFKTGDTAVYENGVYRIVGRTSVDIIKSGGYKISALEVERHLLAHPDITDCVVVGLPDSTWGQRVAAVLTVRDGVLIEVSGLREWAKDYLPSYQIPTVVKCLASIPRNVMGKVNKKQIVTQIFPEFLNDGL